MSLFYTVSEIWRDNGRKSSILTYPPVFGALVGVIPLEFRRDLWHQKTRVHGLS